jgi:hypothetical protein
MNRISIACAIVALCCITPFANAVAVVYTTSASFNAAVPVTTLEDFNAGAPASAPFVNGIITTSDPNGGDLVARGAPLFAVSQSVTLSTSTSPPTIQFAFSSPITAVGFDIWDLGTVGATNLTFTLSNGDVGSLATAFTGGTGNQIFRGVSSSSAFNSITLTNSSFGDFIEFDNARYASAQVVPLPAAAWFGFALIGGIGAKRAHARRKNDVA